MPVPGQFIFADDPIDLNEGRRTITLLIKNTGDRAAQIGSHFHFFEVNRALEFDRPQAMGMRLNIPAGTSVRFEPGQERDVELVEIAGTQRAVGFNALTMGSVTAKWNVKKANDLAEELGFRSAPEADMPPLPPAASPAGLAAPATGATAKGSN
jgi:urease beta subunit